MRGYQQAPNVFRLHIIVRDIIKNDIFCPSLRVLAQLARALASPESIRGRGHLVQSISFNLLF